MAAKNWTFTLNNYTDLDHTKLKELGSSQTVTYLIVGKEVGENNTPHLQGYVCFAKRLRFTQVKQFLGTKCHIEKAKGSPEQNRTYCSKDGDYIECGRLPAGAGSRSDLLSVQAAIKAGNTRDDIRDQFFNVYAKYARFFDSYIMDQLKPRTWATENIVFWGKTGTGKTKQVYTFHKLEDIYKHTGERWFDGYEGQPVVLFDDFTGGVFPLSYLLQIMDRYPMKVPIKGGFTQWIPKTIYFTSNINPDDWYSGAIQEHRNALKRRINKITEFKN